MNTATQYIKNIFTKMPVVFPLIAVFHLLWLVWILTGIRSEIFSTELLIRISWMTLYAICWIAASDRKKWGALGYLLLTLTNMVLFLVLKTPLLRDTYMSSLFLIDGLFSFFLLFYFKQFE